MFEGLGLCEKKLDAFSEKRKAVWLWAITLVRVGDTEISG